jgi:hypothetical protein
MIKEAAWQALTVTIVFGGLSRQQTVSETH